MHCELEKKLERPDVELFKIGGCHIFAVVLADHLESRGFILSRMESETLPWGCEDGQARHVFLLRGDTMVDVEGVQSLASYIERDLGEQKQEALNALRAVRCTKKELLTETKKTEHGHPGNKWNLILDPEFRAECERRARAIIEHDPKKYLVEPGVSNQPSA